MPVARTAAAIGEEYAQQHQLLVTNLDAPRGKVDAQLASSLVDQASQIVILEKKGGKTFDALIVQAKEKGKSGKLILI